MKTLAKYVRAIAVSLVMTLAMAPLAAQNAGAPPAAAQHDESDWGLLGLLGLLGLVGFRKRKKSAVWGNQTAEDE